MLAPTRFKARDVLANELENAASLQNFLVLNRYVD